MTESGDLDCEALLSHAGWVRALARHLTADAHAADDLAQDALAAALVAPPPSGRPLRGWLSGIVRNLARHERRSAGARSARERAVAREDEEADESGAQLLERLEAHRAVVEAVARLPEPYRTAILLRYFEGLSPAAIASRTGVPTRTVHTRLHRALSRLRAELDQAHGGDRKAWLLALVPIARGPGGWSALGAGVVVMDVKWKLALAAAAVLGIWSTIALWSGEEDGASLAAQPKDLGIAALAPEEEYAPRELDGAPSLGERRAPESSRSAEPSAPAPAAESSALLGRVIDVEGAAVAGLWVRADDVRADRAAIEATTDADGRFEIEADLERGHVDVASPGWTSVFRPEFPAAAGRRELVLVVARSRTLAGVVVDERGSPVASARLAVPLPFGMRSRWEAVLDGSSSVEREASSGADGRFEMLDVPIFPGAVLATTHAAYLPDERPLPAELEGELEIVLRSSTRRPERLVGTVVDAGGIPVVGAWVALGSATTKSGPGGAFAFDLSASGDVHAITGEDSPATLSAVKAGHLPARLAREEDRDWPDPLVLRLGDPPLAVAGRVVDADGRPVPWAEVWTDEETRFGYIAIEGGEMSMRAGANVEAILRGDPWTARVKADADGRFELRGLLARDYRLHAFDRRRMVVGSASFAAGARGAEIRMPREAVHERVAGRVTSLSGEPLAGFEVVLRRQIAGVGGLGAEQLWSAAATADAEGRFSFAEVSRHVTSVAVQSPELGPVGFERAIRPEDDVLDLELAVPLRVHVQVEPAGQADFDQVAVLDGREEELELSVDHGKSSYTMRRVHLQEGRTEPFSVSETASTLVLYRQKAEVRRVPLALVRSELNVVRP